MVNLKKVVLMSILAISAIGCTTTGKFSGAKPGDQLYFSTRPQAFTVQDDGTVVTPPYFWNAIAGIPYRVERNGKTVKEGKAKAHFRVVSIFWPPFALIYWPAGFDPNAVTDVSTPTARAASPAKAKK